MESENTFANKTQLTSQPLSEPHFDQEATLLSARPVVPLNDVKANARSKGRLFFALAIMISLLLGAFSAILIGYLRHADDQATDNLSAGTREPTSVASEPVNLVSSSREAGASSSESDTTAAAKRIGEPASSIHGGRKSRAAKNQTPDAARGAGSSPASKAIQNEVPRVDWDGRAANRERSEARRRRRETPLKSRKNSDESADDLLRIGEIFEGPRP